MWDTKKNYFWLLIIVFASFLVFGFSENIKGPAIPLIQSDFSMNEMNIGLLLALNSLGYLLACSFTNGLTQKIGIKKSLNISLFAMTGGGILMFFSLGAYMLFGSYFIMYIGNGMLEIALAILTAKIFTKNIGTMMNITHFFYGLSSVFAPLMASRIMQAELGGALLGWRGMYILVLSLALIPIIPTIFTKFPGGEVADEDKLSIKEYIKDPIILISISVLTLGVISELAVGGWLVNYLQKVYNWNMQKASLLLSGFFVCFTLARLVLGPITDKIGFIKSLIIFSSFSGICSIAAVWLGEGAFFLFALAGAGIAPIYPTIMAFLAKRYKKSAGGVISFTVTIMGIGNIVGNFLVGAIVDTIKNTFTASIGGELGTVAGFRAGYTFIGGCALLCAICALILLTKLRKQDAVI